MILRLTGAAGHADPDIIEIVGAAAIDTPASVYHVEAEALHKLLSATVPDGTLARVVARYLADRYLATRGRAGVQGHIYGEAVLVLLNGLEIGGD